MERKLGIGQAPDTGQEPVMPLPMYSHGLCSAGGSLILTLAASWFKLLSNLNNKDVMPLFSLLWEVPFPLLVVIELSGCQFS